MENRPEIGEYPEWTTPSESECIKCHKKIRKKRPSHSERVETERSAPQIEDDATVRTPQECGESSRNVLTASFN